MKYSGLDYLEIGKGSGGSSKIHAKKLKRKYLQTLWILLQDSGERVWKSSVTLVTKYFKEEEGCIKETEQRSWQSQKKGEVVQGKMDGGIFGLFYYLCNNKELRCPQDTHWCTHCTRCKGFKTCLKEARGQSATQPHLTPWCPAPRLESWSTGKLSLLLRLLHLAEVNDICQTGYRRSVPFAPRKAAQHRRGSRLPKESLLHSPSNRVAIEFFPTQWNVLNRSHQNYSPASCVSSPANTHLGTGMGSSEQGRS